MQNIMKFSEAGQRYSDIEGINQFSKHDALHCDDATKLKIVRRIVHKIIAEKEDSRQINIHVTKIISLFHKQLLNYVN